MTTVQEYGKNGAMSSDEYFTFLTARYNVTTAKEIVRGRDPTEEIGVDAWASQLLSPDPEEEPDKILAMRISVNWEHVPNVDLREPVILAWFFGKTSSGHILIDGHHRLAKARREGVPSLQAHVLTKEESKGVLA